jgi:hypothetical protein
MKKKNFITETPDLNLIKLFSFVTDDKAQEARGFALGNPFQLGLRIRGQGQSKPTWRIFQMLPSWVSSWCYQQMLD